MKGKFRFKTIADARIDIAKWIAGERQAFETKFAPKMALVPAER